MWLFFFPVFLGFLTLLYFYLIFFPCINFYNRLMAAESHQNDNFLLSLNTGQVGFLGMKCIIMPVIGLRKKEGGLNRTENIEDEAVYTKVNTGRECIGD